MNFDNIFQKYGQVYENIFQSIYPSTGDTGFTERNQTVNFSKAYEQVMSTSKVATWFEFEFNKTNHYDAIIINDTSKEIILIEAKRIKDRTKFSDDITKDIKRINNFKKYCIDEEENRFIDKMDYKMYGMILADVWEEGDWKPAIPALFKVENNGFIQQKLENGNEQDFNDLHYYHLDFKKINPTNISNSIRKNYNLLGFFLAS